MVFVIGNEGLPLFHDPWSFMLLLNGNFVFCCWNFQVQHQMLMLCCQFVCKVTYQHHSLGSQGLPQCHCHLYLLLPPVTFLFQASLIPSQVRHLSSQPGGKGNILIVRGSFLCGDIYAGILVQKDIVGVQVMCLLRFNFPSIKRDVKEEKY